MGNKRRGHESMETCASCGRRAPRDKVVRYDRTIVYSTDLKTADDVKVMQRRKMYYCVSCGKSRGIFEKKKRQAMAKYNR
ncbi:hypothetical protein HY570_01900 [Candidatus Micrarchaeota archaeon]|nr:hypothetical protein [Candidatus Micrarchaeota archaeon]